MKSTISSAVLSAALLAQVSMAATIGHPHGHHVHRRTAAPAPVPEENIVVKFMAPTDIALFSDLKIRTGRNLACTQEGKTDTAPVTVGGTGGPFVVQFNNKASEDLTAVLWSGENKTAAVAASFIGTGYGTHQPDVTHTLKANTSTWVSLNPDLVTSKSLSGAFAALRKDGTLSSVSGQLDDTWGEFTFTTDSQFSTTDVSRLINMRGSRMEIHNYLNKDDADDDDVPPACSSTMEKCAFVCVDTKLNMCIDGHMTDCAVGTPGTTASANGKDGGCGGMSAKGGYVVVDFF